MDDNLKSKAELIAELNVMRRKVAERKNYSLNDFIRLGIFKTLLNFAPVPVAVLDKDGNFLFLNDAYVDL